MKVIELIIVGSIMIVAFFNIIFYDWDMRMEWYAPVVGETKVQYLDNTEFGLWLLAIVVVYLFIRAIYVTAIKK